MEIIKTFHPEFGRHVYQPIVPGYPRFIEPFVTEKEAKAFLDGVKVGELLEKQKNVTV